MTNGIAPETNGTPPVIDGITLLECPCCGSAATVEPHLIEAGCTVGDQIWTDWWTASVNCDSCPLQFIAGGDTEEEAVRNAVEGWNRRAAVTDHDFAVAVHDGELWRRVKNHVRCPECGLNIESVIPLELACNRHVVKYCPNCGADVPPYGEVV